MNFTPRRVKRWSHSRRQSARRRPVAPTYRHGAPQPGIPPHPEETAARPPLFVGSSDIPPPCPEGTKQLSPGQATRSPGLRRSPSAALKVRDRAGLTMRPVVPALSRPCRAPDATLMNPGLRKALPRALFSRPVGAPIQHFRFQSEVVGSGEAEASAPMVSGHGPPRWKLRFEKPSPEPPSRFLIRGIRRRHVPSSPFHHSSPPVHI
jgi:hypothetical protein